MIERKGLEPSPEKNILNKCADKILGQIEGVIASRTGRRGLSATVGLALFATACGEAPQPVGPTITPEPIQPVSTEVATISPTETIEPSPTPDIRDVLREGIESVLGVQAYDAEELQERARTPEREAELLAAVPSEERAAFLEEYLEAQTILDNREELRELAQSPNVCSPDVHSVIIDAVHPSLSIWYKAWGRNPGQQEYERLLEGNGLPGLSERPYVIIECGNLEESFQRIETLGAEKEAQLVAEEDAAEAILADMLRNLFSRTFDGQMSTQVEFEQTRFTQLVTFNSKTGEVLSSDYYPIELTQDNIQATIDELYRAVFNANPLYMPRVMSVSGFARDSSQQVPVVGSADRLSSAEDIINGAVHQLIGPYPLGSAEGTEGSTVTETFAVIAERELFREFLSAEYPQAAASEFYAKKFERLFDSEGRHASLPKPTSDNPLDPALVYGANELGHAIFELRNCTIDQGMSLGDFFTMMKDVDTAEKVYSALNACQNQP